MSKETLKKQLVDYLMDENLDTLQRIGILEMKFRKFWDTDEEDDSYDELNKLSKTWGDELKEQWGKLSLIMKLFKDFNLDEGRNSQMFKESKVGGDCFYWVDNYEVKIDDRNLSKKHYHPMDNEGYENLLRDLTELETIKELKEGLKKRINFYEGLGKPTYEDVLEDFYYDETDDTNDYIVCSGCKSEIKMLFMGIDYYLNNGFTKEDLQPLYNSINDYQTLLWDVRLKD